MVSPMMVPARAASPRRQSRVGGVVLAVGAALLLQLAYFGARCQGDEAFVSQAAPGQLSSALPQPAKATGALAAGTAPALLGEEVVRGRVAVAGAPKSRRAYHLGQKHKRAWYRNGEYRARYALKLGKAIRAGNINFIYGKPQDEDEDEDDDYVLDDEEMEDSDDE